MNDDIAKMTDEDFEKRAPEQRMITCPGCGAQLPNNDAYCESCNHYVREVTRNGIRSLITVTPPPHTAPNYPS